MNILRAIWPDFIDAELPLTKKEREEITRQAWKQWSGTGRNIALSMLLLAAWLLLMMVAIGLLDPLLARAMITLPGWLSGTAPTVGFGVIPVLGGLIFRRIGFAPCVYRATRMAGMDVCLRCGYWLRGLAESEIHCPECGAIRHAMPRGAED